METKTNTEAVYAAYAEIVGAEYYKQDEADEAYAGYFNSDKDFAMDMADQLGLIDDDIQWPYTCIDWEHAAKELMYDYSEHEGHYFRNL